MGCDLGEDSRFLERKNEPSDKETPKILSYLPLRTYLLSLLIIGGIFSLKAQEKEPKSPEEQTIKRYKVLKLELAAPLTRFSFYGGREFEWE